jgi:hypothetical protein
MKITSVTVEYSRLVTGDNFSNKKFGCSLTASISESEISSYAAVREELEKRCVGYVESRISGEDVIVVTKEQAEKIKKLVGAVYDFKSNELPF